MENKIKQKKSGIFRFHYVDKEGITGVDFRGKIFQLHLFQLCCLLYKI